jgi:hypothetical protein
MNKNALRGRSDITSSGRGGVGGPEKLTFDDGGRGGVRSTDDVIIIFELRNKYGEFTTGDTINALKDVNDDAD